MVLFTLKQCIFFCSHKSTCLFHIRKHTEYYGGYHEHHRVISWLWDIVKNDFSSEEKGKLLKVGKYAACCVNFSMKLATSKLHIPNLFSSQCAFWD